MVYNPYRAGGPEERIQRKTTSIATAPIRAAVNVGALAPAKAAYKEIIEPVGQAIARPFTEANERNRFAVAKPQTIGNAGNREADTMLYGEGTKRVFSPNEARVGLPTASAPITPLASGLQRDQIQSQRIDQPTQQSFMLAAQPRSTAAEAMAINGPEQATQRVFTNRGDRMYSEQRPVTSIPTSLRTAPQRSFSRGNLDITFDPSVDQAAQQRFLENPVRPTAQIDRFEARRGMDDGQGQRAAQNADRVLGLNKNVMADGDLFTKENSPGMGWKERKEMNQQLLANRQSGQNAQLQAGTTLSTSAAENQNRYNIAQGGNQTSLDVARMSEGTAKERNVIDRMNVEGSNLERAASAKGKEIENEQKQALTDAHKAYVGEKDPAKQQALGEQLLTLMGKTKDLGYGTLDQYNEDGTKTGQILYNKGTGEARGEQQQAQQVAPQTAIEYLKNNPKEAANFKAKYGYLPKGY